MSSRRTWLAVTTTVLSTLVLHPAQAEIMTMQEALVNAYRFNPELSAQREALKAVDERVPQAISGFRPNARASWDRGKARNSSNGGPTRTSDRDNRNLEVRQSIFSGLGTMYAWDAAEFDVQAQRQSLKNSEQNILLDAATAYVDILRTRRLLDLSKKNEEVLKKHAQATDDRFAVGEVTRTDTAQSASRLALAVSERVQAEANAAIAVTTFERIIQDRPAGEIALDFPALMIPETLEEAISIARGNNPTLLQRQFTQESAKENIGLQRSQLLPSVDVIGTMNRTEGSQFFNGSFREDRVLMNLSVPLYESGSVYSQTRQAKRQHEQAKYDALDTGNRVAEAVTRGWEQWLAAKATIEATETAISAAQTALEGVTQEHLYGSRTTLDVLDAEQELFQTQVNLVTAQRNEAVAQFNLAVLIGNFTATDLKLPVEIYNPEEYYNDNKYKMLGF